jgi:hypothetical protein
VPTAGKSDKRFINGTPAPTLPRLEGADDWMAGCMQMLDVEYYHALAGAGIQYFVVEVMDAADVETIQLLAEQVMPHVQLGTARNRAWTRR